LSLEQSIPVLERVRNISFLSTILEPYEIALSRKPFGIGHMYMYTFFFLRLTDTMTSNTDLSSWNTLYRFYSTKTLRFHYKDQTVDGVSHKNRCALREKHKK
jgi:hypothetical protein